MLTGNSYEMDFNSMPEGVKIGTVSLLMVSSAACKTELSPFSIDLLKTLAPDVDSKTCGPPTIRLSTRGKPRRQGQVVCQCRQGLKMMDEKADAEAKAAAEKRIADDSAVRPVRER